MSFHCLFPVVASSFTASGRVCFMIVTLFQVNLFYIFMKHWTIYCVLMLEDCTVHNYLSRSFRKLYLRYACPVITQINMRAPQSYQSRRWHGPQTKYWLLLYSGYRFQWPPQGGSSVAVFLWPCVGVFIWSICFVIICSPSFLLLVTLEGCTSWLWHFLCIFTYIFVGHSV